jgi:predicted nucleotidyltransferase
VDEIAQVIDAVDAVLGADTVGVYLYGSSVLGGLRPASDIDVLVVSRRSLRTEDRRSLLTKLLGISGTPNGGRPVEVSVVVQDEVRPWHYPPMRDFAYGEWLRTEYEGGLLPQRGPAGDLALTITEALAGNRALIGPPPAQVLDPVPHDDVVRASVAGVPGLLDDLGSDTRNVLLTLARIWTTLGTGRIVSKNEAADWASERLPAEVRPPLAHARALYLTTPYVQESWTPALRADVDPTARSILAAINGLAAGVGRQSTTTAPEAPTNRN